MHVKPYMNSSRSADPFDNLADVMRARQEAWRDQARCSGIAYTKPRAFFPVEANGGQEAKEVCKKCPVKRECYEDWKKQPPANQHHGVWFGTTPLDRETARKSGKSLTPK